MENKSIQSKIDELFNRTNQIKTTKHTEFDYQSNLIANTREAGMENKNNSRKTMTRSFLDYNPVVIKSNLKKLNLINPKPKDKTMEGNIPGSVKNFYFSSNKQNNPPSNCDLISLFKKADKKPNKKEEEEEYKKEYDAYEKFIRDKSKETITNFSVLDDRSRNNSNNFTNLKNLNNFNSNQNSISNNNLSNLNSKQDTSLNSKINPNGEKFNPNSGNSISNKIVNKTSNELKINPKLNNPNKTSDISSNPNRSDGSFLLDHLNLNANLLEENKTNDFIQNNHNLQFLLKKVEANPNIRISPDCEVLINKEEDEDYNCYPNTNNKTTNNHIFPNKITYKPDDPFRLLKFSTEEIYEKVLDPKFYKQLYNNSDIHIPDNFSSGNHYKYVWINNFFNEMKHALLSAKIENFDKNKYFDENVKINLTYRNEISETKVKIYTINANRTLNFHKNKIFKDNDIFAIYLEEDFKDQNKHTVDFSLKNLYNRPYFIGIVNYERSPKLDQNSFEFLCRIHSNSTIEIKEECLYSVQLLGNLTTFLREYQAILQMNELSLSEALLNPKLFYNQNKLQKMNDISNLFMKQENFNKDEISEHKIPSIPSNKPIDASKIFIEKIMNSNSFNKSQKEAILKTSQLKSKDLLLIQGPPGTGKTHTIIGIISLFYLQNPSTRIVICAPSNNAVDEIAIRLASKGLLDKNLNYFRPDFIRFGLFDREEKDSKYMNSHNLTMLQKYSLEKLIEEKYMEKEKILSDKLDKIKTKIEEASKKIDKCYSRIEELKTNEEISTQVKEKEIRKIQRAIEKYYQNKKELKSEKENLSLEKKDNLNHKKLYEKQLLEKTRILFTTLNSAGNERIKSYNVNYDCMILDEACQCVEPSAIIPLHLGVKKLIMVGDHMQLPATVFSDKASLVKYNRSYFERLIDNNYGKKHILTIQYRMHSNIRNFIGKTFYEDKLQDDEIISKRLNDSALYQLINVKYNFSLFDLKNSEEKFLNSGKSYINIKEANFVVNLLNTIQGLIEEYNKNVEEICLDLFNNFETMEGKNTSNKGGKRIYPKYAIISPYKAQVKLLTDEISKSCHEFLPFIEINTVDSFQGREQDIVIISTVRSNFDENLMNTNSIGFLNDYRRMNVALSRGKLGCFIVGNARTLINNQYWQKLIGHCLINDSLFPIRDSYFKDGNHFNNIELIQNLMKKGKPLKISINKKNLNSNPNTLEEGEVKILDNYDKYNPQEFMNNSIGIRNSNNIEFDLNLDLRLYHNDLNELRKSLHDFNYHRENEDGLENKSENEFKMLSRKTKGHNDQKSNNTNRSAKNILKNTKNSEMMID